MLQMLYELWIRYVTRSNGTKTKMEYHEFPSLSLDRDVEDIAFLPLNFRWNCESVTTFIFDLPEEVISYIFSFLDVHFLVTKISLVCKGWRDLVRSDSFWKSLRAISIEEMRGDATFSESIIRSCPNLQFLKVKKYCGKDYGPFPDPTIPDLTVSRLQTLSLHYIDYDWDLNLRAILSNATRLTSLHLHGRISSYMVGLISEKTHITSLTFDFTSRKEIPIIRNNLIKVFQNLVGLSQFSISFCGHIDEGVVNTLLQYHAPSLTRLTLDVYITDDSFSNITNCAKLVELRAHCAGMSDLSLQRMQSLSRLRTLRLNNGLRFSTDGLKKFFTGDSFPDLRNLTISVCGRFVDSTLMALAHNYPTLRSLTIGCCANISNTGVTFIMRWCHELQILRLQGVELDPESLFRSCAEPYLPRLRYLAVLGYNIPMRKEKMQQFVQWHPSYKTQPCVIMPHINDNDELYTRYLENPHLKPVAIFINNGGRPVTVGHPTTSGFV